MTKEQWEKVKKVVYDILQNKRKYNEPEEINCFELYDILYALVDEDEEVTTDYSEYLPSDTSVDVYTPPQGDCVASNFQCHTCSDTGQTADGACTGLCPECKGGLFRAMTVPDSQIKLLSDKICKALDDIGLELKVWNDDYFGRVGEDKCILQLAEHLIVKGKIKLEGE